MPDPEPRPRLGGRRACLTASGDGLVLYDGGRLWHLPSPLGRPETDGPRAGWRLLPGVPGAGVVALDSGPDLNHHHEQLFALTEDGELHSWTQRSGADAETGAGADAGGEWVGWPVDRLDRPAAALATWSTKPGHQELVVAAADGSLLGRRQVDWGTDPQWDAVGVAPQAVALDAVLGPQGGVELFVLTAEGELKIKRQRPEAGGPGRWSGIETVAGWAQPAVATTSWTIPGDIQHQAVVLSGGAVHQRWREGPSADWSDWWSAPPLGLDREAVAALPAALAGATEAPPAPGRHGRQFLAALVGRERVVVRRWTPADGWQPWEEALDAPPDAPTDALPLAGRPDDSADGPPHEQATWWDSEHATRAVPFRTTAPDRSGEQPTVAVSVPTGTVGAEGSTEHTETTETISATETVETTALADTAETAALAAPRAEPDPVTEPTTRSAIRTEGATVLFTGRELLPLRDDDPLTIGPFKLQRRVAGGQGGTDKFVARDGRGYCFLKVLRPVATADEVTAFRRESAIAQRVTDRHRLATYIDHRDVPPRPGDPTDRSDPTGAEHSDEPAFLALAFVPGRHLGELVKRRALVESDLIRLARSLLEALEELRGAGIIHADLKPANVIMRDDHYPVLVDFGSAVPAGTTVITEAAFGTTGYAPPELTDRRATGPGTDVYGWGAVMITAATGEAPAADPDERQQQLGRLPASLRPLVSAALDDEPANRPELAYARRELSRIVPASDDGLIRDRLPLEVAARKSAPVRLTDDRPRRLTARAAELTVWQYRGALGVAALAGIIIGLIIGTFLITWLRSL